VFIRPINPDEAFYSISANELLNNKLPYVDFLFHQTPLILPVYALVSIEGYWSLILGRLLSYFIFLISLLLINKYLLNENKRNSWLLLVMFFFNSFLLNWILVIKTYSLTILILICGIIFIKQFLTSTESSRKILFAFMGGSSFSLLFLTRISFGIIILVLVVYIFFYLVKNKNNGKVKIICSLLGGILLPLLIFTIIFRNNLILVYLNLIQLNQLFILGQDQNIIKSLFSYHQFFLNPQNLLLILIILYSRKKYNLHEFFVILIIVSFYLVQLFTQELSEYLAPILPLIIILALNSFNKFENNIQRKYKLNFNTTKSIFIILYIISLPFGSPDFKHFILDPEISYTSPKTLYNVSSIIYNLDSKTVLSSWEGFSFYSNKQPIFQDGYITSFLVNIDVPMDKRIKEKIITRDKYENLIENKIPDLIVYDFKEARKLLGQKEDIEKNYELISKCSDVWIYKRK
jgi:hypothetical protein